LLGGFTTFSAWQLEAVSAARAEGAPIQAFGILFGSLAVGFAACWMGYVLGQRLR
jgi:fluoride ion exporter CrcB/FEX